MTEQVALFTTAGQFVAAVHVEMTPEGRWPRVVVFQGLHYGLENGRYVQEPDVSTVSRPGEFVRFTSGHG